MTKVTTLSEAVASIPQGAHVALSGFATARCAMAFAHEVIRQDLKELTVSQCVGAMDADILAGAGVLSRIIYGGGSRGRTGQHFCLNRAIEQGTIIAEEYSSLSMAFRYLAGSLGLPFIPIRSLQGSDILKHVQEVAPDTTGT
ncbi:MAG TPA: CoA transferase subunit A, partial [Chloroflexi bacterium]|nr:CoA transferase subunit A [Chloroflexota bacterium]